ncbi:YafY family transcriptional regulator [Rhodohalobacter sp. SW132]|uniref:helix-turn-helix transcriptional regulator n=1 Tax=Rhodohalobacter sp. SW132 TaxID=2293433 RepID=UPI000E2773CE|nr:YafY family protein [Rhodohalobacter sp. SW132]REL37809.1 YafY family transcriptional regulator [Rhodohalobacter sp. SW132]
MNRIDRLTGIIIYLQGRKGVAVEELAERYGISSRTVYRDLKALGEAGVPLTNDPKKGWQIIHGFHLPPVMFSRDEASALIAGERLMQKWSETRLGKSYVSALDKIRSTLPSESKEYVEVLDHHTRIIPHSNGRQHPPDNDIFSFLQKAIYAKELIEITYHSPYSDKKTTREVEPLGILLMTNHWYLAGWCRLRKDYRMFRTDRFEKWKGTSKKLIDPPSHTLQEYYDRELKNEDNFIEIVIHFDSAVTRYIGDQKYWHGWISEKKTDTGIEMTFLTSGCDYFCRWLLIWGDGATIIRPASIRNRVKGLVEELVMHYK